MNLFESPITFDHSETRKHGVFLEAGSLATPRALRFDPSALVERDFLPFFSEVVVVIVSVMMLR